MVGGSYVVDSSVRLRNSAAEVVVQSDCGVATARATVRFIGSFLRFWEEMREE